MIQKVTFAPTGKTYNGKVKNKTARVTIPSAYVELMKITPDDRDVEITFENGKIIIAKVNN